MLIRGAGLFPQPPCLHGSGFVAVVTGIDSRLVLVLEQDSYEIFAEVATDFQYFREKCELTANFGSIVVINFNHLGKKVRNL